MSLHSSTTLRELRPLNLAAVAAGARRPVVLMQTVGKEVAVELQNHFKARDKEGNRHGWPSQHFWRKVANKTSHQNATADGVTVTVASREFVHKLSDGTIYAKAAGALAIPLTAEAYAKQGKGTLRESFPGLFPISTKNGGFLIRKPKGKGAQQGPPEFLFRLVKSVFQKADPRALPPDSAIDGAINRAIAGYANRNPGGAA